jgi:hypothetical protein
MPDDSVGHQWLNTELLGELRPWIDTGQVVVEFNNQGYFDNLDRDYPTTGNTIAWGKITPRKTADVLPSGDKEYTRQEQRVLLSNRRHVVRGWFQEAGITPDGRGVWIGDLGDLAFTMTTNMFIELMPIILSYAGQHHYFVGTDGTWCLHYTIVGHLVFGLTKDCKHRGWVTDEE